jgi:hypothetical protein
MDQGALDTVSKRVIIFTGNYGSGKTEVSVNYTLALAQVEPRLSIVDLDVVNPYFRCREAIAPLEEAGVEVIVPRGETFASELPIILPEVKGAITREHGRVVLDVGGDNVGARVLSSFGGSLPPERAELLMVLNARRPFTDTLEGAVQIIREIEAASRLRVGGLVSNTHLMEETSVEMVLEGVALAQAVGGELNVPLRFVAAMQSLVEPLGDEELPCPVLPMERRMLPPWISPLRQGRGRFRQIGLD